jgi:hypothetical protein
LASVALPGFPMGASSACVTLSNKQFDPRMDLLLSDCMILYRSSRSHLCRTALHDVISISAIPDHLRAELLQAPVLLSGAAAPLAAARCIDMRDFGDTACSRSLGESTTRH